MHSETGSNSMTQPTQSTAHLSADEKRRLLAKLLKKKAERKSIFPLSHGQRGMWVISQMDRDNPVLNMPFCSRFRTLLDLSAFRSTMQTLVDRHACFRTRFYEANGELFQSVEPSATISVDVHDASGLNDDQLRERLVEELSRPFSLEQCPLMRVALFARAPDDHVCLLSAHHIVIDFWSTVVLQRELHTLYSQYKHGRRVDLPAVDYSFFDYVEWQQQLLSSDRGRRLSAFWKKQLADVDHVLRLPADLPRPSVFTHRGNSATCKINADITERLNALASEENATLFSVLMAGFQVLLSKYCNQEKLIVGSPFSGRGSSEFEKVVGCLTNLLPIRGDLSGDPSFRQVVDRTFDNVLDVLQHQEYPYSLIVEESSVDRDPSRPPMLQASFIFQKSQLRDQAMTTQFQVPGLDAKQTYGALAEQTFYIEHPSCQHDLELLLEHSGNAINGMLRYYADAFESRTIERMVRNLIALLDSVTKHPDTPLSQLDWFDAEERKLVIETWNDTDVDFGAPVCIHSRFEAQAAATPDAIAVSYEQERTTYAELDGLANRMANQLIAAGVRRGDSVAVDLERSVDLIVCLIAIMKSGAAYLPLDPNSPPERKRQILADANPTIVISTEKNDFDDSPQFAAIADLLAANESYTPIRPDVDVSSDDVAYVIFTSGSTGKPKGVVVEHKAIGNTISWRQHQIPVDHNDRVLLLVPHYFDASLCITLHALLGGAQLVLANSEVTLNPTALGDCILETGITLLPMPPRLLRVLLEHGEFEKLHSITRIHTGGETMPPELPSMVHRALSVSFENLYGPTEVAVEATWKSCTSNATDANCIGKPIANVRTYVLDQDLRPVPIGVRGELCISGSGLARGYLNDDQLTASRFIQDPFVRTLGNRMYRTGDQCRWLPSGELEFIARLDDQVKIRGYRIELGEVEHSIRQHPSVTDVAAVAHLMDVDERTLVAYVVADPDRTPTANELRSFVESRLPNYMVPQFIEFLDELPFTSTGKLDRAALPEPFTERATRMLVAPRNELEEFLVDIWEDLLPGQTVGIHDNFYDLGGSSLKGAMLLSRLQDRLGQQIRLATVFHLPDVASLARYLGETYPELVTQEFGVDSLPDEKMLEDQSTNHGLLVGLQTNGQRPPLFLVHPPGGIVACYQTLARLMPKEQPVFGIRSRGLYGDEELPTTLEEMASEYVHEIRAVRPNGPFVIGGWSLGGVIAYEMAQQLLAAGETVEHLVMLDTTVPSNDDGESGREYGLEITFGELAELPAEEQLPYLWQHAQKLGVVEDETPETLVAQILADLQRLFHHHVTLANNYTISSYPGRITMFRPEDAPVAASIAPDRGWKSYADVDIEFVPGQHHSMVKPPHVEVLAEQLISVLKTPAST